MLIAIEQGAILAKLETDKKAANSADSLAGNAIQTAHQKATGTFCCVRGSTGGILQFFISYIDYMVIFCNKQ